jgi:hypothetical protein
MYKEGEAHFNNGEVAPAVALKVTPSGSGGVDVHEVVGFVRVGDCADAERVVRVFSQVAPTFS